MYCKNQFDFTIQLNLQLLVSLAQTVNFVLREETPHMMEGWRFV